jgi:hypothetical protein
MLGVAAAFTVAAFGGGATTPAVLAVAAAFTPPAFACDETLIATVLRTTITLAAIAGPVNPAPAVYDGSLTVRGLTGTATVGRLTS